MASRMDLEGDRLAFIGWGLLVALAGAAWFIAEITQRQPAEGFAIWLLFAGIGGLWLGWELDDPERGFLRSTLIWLGGLSALVSIPILLSLWEVMTPAEAGALAVLFFGIMILMWGEIHPRPGKKAPERDDGEETS